MNYIQYARKISIFLGANIKPLKKFDLCVMQIYLIKKYVKKLKDKYKKD